MKLKNKIYYNIYICAFIYLVLCPAIHQVDDTVYHNIIIKSEARLQERECNEDIDSSPVKAFNALQIEPLGHILTATNHTVEPSLFNLFNLSALSTARLNL